MHVRILREDDIRRLIEPAQSLNAVRQAFATFGRGEATVPPPMGFDILQHHGEVHVKGAYLHGAPFYSIKEATGFYDNPQRGLPVGSGVIVVFDATTGFLQGLLLDNGYLTELRTASAGALAADLLAKQSIRRVGIIGSGVQARFQLEALLLVRKPDDVVVYSPSADHAASYARDMTAKLGLPVIPVAGIHEVIDHADLVVTTTPTRTPIVRADWLHAGLHITAMGSDGPEKQELEPEILAAPAKVVADSLDQCLRLGEVHHAVEAGILKPDDVYAELGEIATGAKPGRTDEDEITIADLTGVGIQDAAVANYVMAEAMRQGAGHTLNV